MVDLTQPKSLQSVDTWIEEIYAKADVEEPVIMILANKRDVEQSKKLMTNKQIEEFQRAHEE